MTERLPRNLIEATRPTTEEWNCLVSPVDPSCLTDLASATAPQKAEVEHLISSLQELTAQQPHAEPSQALDRSPSQVGRWALGAGLVAAAASAAVITSFDTDVASPEYTLVGPHLATGKPQVVGAGEVVQVGPAVDIQGPATVALTQFGPQGTILELQDGRLYVSVDSESPFRNVLVDAGDVSVQVQGTRFLVDRDGENVAVTVFEGDVITRYPDGVRYLGPGEAFAWPPLGDQPTEKTEAPALECDGKETPPEEANLNGANGSAEAEGSSEGSTNRSDGVQVDDEGQDLKFGEVNGTSVNPNGGSSGVQGDRGRAGDRNANGGASGSAAEGGRGQTVVPGRGNGDAGAQGAGWSSGTDRSPNAQFTPEDEETSGFCFDPSMQWRASPPSQSEAPPMTLDDLEDFLAQRTSSADPQQTSDATPDNAKDPASAAFELIVERFEEQRRPNDTLELLESWLERYPEHPMSEEGHQILLQLLVDIRSSDGS